MQNLKNQFNVDNFVIHLIIYLVKQHNIYRKVNYFIFLNIYAAHTD